MPSSKSHFTDEEFARLTEAMGRGDKEAWRVFVAHYGRHLKRIIRFRLKRRQRDVRDSDDVLQETLVRLLEKPSLLQRPATERDFDALIAKTIYNHIADIRRKDAARGQAVHLSSANAECLANPRGSRGVAGARLTGGHRPGRQQFADSGTASPGRILA